MNQELAKVFKRGSKTYFNSSLFFPKKVREEVFELYAFVRVADDFVDEIPQDKESFYAFKQKYLQAITDGKTSGDIYVDTFISLSRKRGFDPAWGKAFLRSMEMDLSKKKYNTLSETLEYIYGSAEVIGLFMSVIMGLSKEAWPFAQELGKSMQYINFIRDIAEDVELGRTYIPLEGTDFPDLSLASVEKDPDRFVTFIKDQADLYLQWQKNAEQGYKYIPYRSLIPIKTAADMYQWTAREIQKDPFVVYRKKVKPSKFLIIMTLIKNTFTLLGRKNV